MLEVSCTLRTPSIALLKCDEAAVVLILISSEFSIGIPQELNAKPTDTANAMLIFSATPFTNMVIAYIALAGGTGLMLCGLSRSKGCQKAGYFGMLILLFMAGWINSCYGIRGTAGDGIAFFNGVCMILFTTSAIHRVTSQNIQD